MRVGSEVDWSDFFEYDEDAERDETAKRVLSRAEWLDTHKITDKSLRRSVMRDFRNSHSIETFIAQVRKAEREEGPSDVESILRFPGRVSEKPEAALEWLSIIHARNITTESREGQAEETILRYRRANVPFSYVRDHPCSHRWSATHVTVSWRLGLDAHTLGQFTRTGHFPAPHEVKPRHINHSVDRFVRAGVPVEYLGEGMAGLPDRDIIQAYNSGISVGYYKALNGHVPHADILMLHRAGLTAQAVNRYLEANPGSSAQDALDEASDLPPEYWNAMY